MLIISLATACTVLTLNLSKRGDEGDQVPKIVQFIFFDVIARVLFINVKSNIKSNLANSSRQIYHALINDFEKLKHQLIYLKTNEFSESNAKKYEFLNNFLRDCCNKHNKEYYTNIKGIYNPTNVLSSNKLSNKTNCSELDACRIATDSRLLLRASPLISIKKRDEEQLILTSDRSSSKFNLEDCDKNSLRADKNNYNNETTTYESIECCPEKKNKSQINQKNISSIIRKNYFNNRTKTNKDPMRKIETSSCREKLYTNKIRKLKRIDKNNLLRDRTNSLNENRTNVGFSETNDANVIKIRNNNDNGKTNKSETAENQINVNTNEMMLKRLIVKLNENLERNELNDTIKEYKGIIKSQWIQLSHVVDALFCYLFVLSTFFLYIYLLYQLP